MSGKSPGCAPSAGCPWSLRLHPTPANHLSPRAHAPSSCGSRRVAQSKAELALNDLYFLDLHSTTWTQPESTGTAPTPRYGHSVTLLPAVRKVVVIGGMDGKGVDSSNAVDHEFPPHKNAKSFCGMAVHMLDLDTMAWSTVTCKNSGTGAEPSARAYHSATLLGKNLFVTGGQVHHGDHHHIWGGGHVDDGGGLGFPLGNTHAHHGIAVVESG